MQLLHSSQLMARAGHVLKEGRLRAALTRLRSGWVPGLLMLKVALRKMATENSSIRCSSEHIGTPRQWIHKHTDAANAFLTSAGGIEPFKNTADLI